MRQAKADDVLGLVSLDEIDLAWPAVERTLGRSRPFWAWLLEWWRARRGGQRILLDTTHQILVNKLCALLGRAELRDMEDVRVLLDRGQSLSRALSDAPKQDAGFSPLTLAWTLRQLPIAKLARALGREQELPALEEQRDLLVDLVLATTATDEAASNDPSTIPVRPESSPSSCAPTNDTSSSTRVRPAAPSGTPSPPVRRLGEGRPGRGRGPNASRKRRSTVLRSGVTCG